MEKKMSALSVRQPYAELILREKKKIEYRTVKTKKNNERIYIYASLTPGNMQDWEKIKLRPGDLPAGYIVGIIEIKKCTGENSDYEWHLKKPERLQKPFKPVKKPQPVSFKPF